MVRDFEDFLALSRKEQHEESAAEAELLAAQRAILFGKEIGLHHVCFKGDAKNIITGLDDIAQNLSPLGHIMEELKLELQTFAICGVHFVPRVSNRAANTIAQMACNIPFEIVRLEKLPPGLGSIVESEVSV